MTLQDFRNIIDLCCTLKILPNDINVDTSDVKLPEITFSTVEDECSDPTQYSSNYGRGYYNWLRAVIETRYSISFKELTDADFKYEGEFYTTYSINSPAGGSEFRTKIQEYCNCWSVKNNFVFNGNSTNY